MQTRKPRPKTQSRANYSAVSEPAVEGGAKLRLLRGTPKLNHLLRSRCGVAFAIISILAMLVVIRSGISASRGYALVETQNQAQQLEQENERLKIEIAKLKSPQRIKQIAEDELGMGVPSRIYFSH